MAQSRCLNAFSMASMSSAKGHAERYGWKGPYVANLERHVKDLRLYVKITGIHWMILNRGITWSCFRFVSITLPIVK